MLRGFRDFIARGNVIDLAVAVVIGVAFGVVVTSLVADLITPLIAAAFGEPDFSALSFTINGSELRYGSFVNALIAFLSVAAAIYFLVVTPINAIERHRHGPDGAKTRDCPFCVSPVPVAAQRCAFCTSELPPTEGAP